MTYEEFVAKAKTDALAAVNAVRSFFAAHPEITSEAAATLKSASDDLAETATATVQASMPAAVRPTIDDAITAVKAAADAKITAIQDQTAAHVAALQSAKASVPQ